MKDHQTNRRPTDQLPTHAIQRHCLHFEFTIDVAWCMASGFVVVVDDAVAAVVFPAVTDADAAVVLL